MTRVRGPLLGQQMGKQCLRGTATDDDRVAVHSPMISQPLTKSCSSAAWPVHEVRRLEGFRPAHGRITADSPPRSAMSLRLSAKNSTIAVRRLQPRWRESRNELSGKPGTVQ